MCSSTRSTGCEQSRGRADVGVAWAIWRIVVMAALRAVITLEAALIRVVVRRGVWEDGTLGVWDDWLQWLAMSTLLPRNSVMRRLVRSIVNEGQWLTIWRFLSGIAILTTIDRLMNLHREIESIVGCER